RGPAPAEAAGQRKRRAKLESSRNGEHVLGVHGASGLQVEVDEQAVAIEADESNGGVPIRRVEPGQSRPGAIRWVLRQQKPPVVPPDTDIGGSAPRAFHPAEAFSSGFRLRGLDPPEGRADKPDR